MYEYKYVTLQVSGLFANNHQKKHRPIIKEMAEKGWRYVGWVPAEKDIDIDLIFERQKEDV